MSSADDSLKSSCTVDNRINNMVHGCVMDKVPVVDRAVDKVGAGKAADAAEDRVGVDRGADGVGRGADVGL